MAVVKWIGGASPVAQVSTVTLPNGYNDSETNLSLTLAAEDGSTTQSVSIIPSGTDEEVIAAALHAACDASSQSLFTQVEFSVASNVITMTARIPGVPFYPSAAVTGGAGAANVATGTASAGPNDWNAAANWSSASVPVDSDDVLIVDSGHSILFGLDQSAIQLSSLRIGESFLGDVGDAAGGFQLIIDATSVHVAPQAGSVRIDGAFADVYVRRIRAGSDALVIGGSVTSLYFDGEVEVRGGVRFLANATIGTLNVLDVASTFRASTSGTTAITTLNQTGGVVEHAGDQISAANLAGGTLVTTGSASLLAVTVWKGASVDHQASGTITAANVRGGTLSFARNRSTAVTLTTLNLSAGVVDLRNNLDNVTVTNNPTVRGGRILTDQGVTTDPKA